MNIDKLKKVIQEMNSRRKWQRWASKDGCDFGLEEIPITLADVLVAIGNKRGILIDTVGIFYDVKEIKPLNIGRAWKIGKTLDNQSDEVKKLLIGLLVEEIECE